MMEMLRNLLRHRLRTVLTILGIAAGSLALTVMGALSEKMNALVNGAAKYYNARVVVQPRAGTPGYLIGPALSADIAETIGRLPGVEGAFATTYALLQEPSDETPSLVAGFPPLLVGIDARRFAYARDRDPLPLVAGRLFTAQERGRAVAGIDLARARQWHVGEMRQIHGREFEIVGILERTLSVRDNMVFVPLRDAQEMLASSLPAPFNAQPGLLASEIEVYPRDIGNAARVAKMINQDIPGVRASPPGEIERRFRQSLIIFDVIAISSAMIAAVVGGLCILNTMVMAVAERASEIGIKKAIGASNADIGTEFLVEAIALGFIGGLLGLMLGFIVVNVLNSSSSLTQGVVIFLITPRLFVVTVVLATLLGAAAGLYPSLLAARRNPVEALRAT